jgi:hypothetical protein
VAQSNSYLAYFKLACLDPSPLYAPTFHPTAVQTSVRPASPTAQPTGQPTKQPTFQLSGHPSGHPSGQPTGQPSKSPSSQPGQSSGHPTAQPTPQTLSPITDIPRTHSPTTASTISDRPSITPTVVPTISAVSPTPEPRSGMPITAPTLSPTTGIPRTHSPTTAPTISDRPSITPTVVPTVSAVSPTPEPRSGMPITAPTLSPTNGIVTLVLIRVAQALAGVTQAALEGSLFARQTFEETVKSSLGNMQGVYPLALVTGYIPTYHPQGIVELSILDVADPTGVKVKYEILFVFASGKSESSIAALTTSVNATLSAAARSGSGEASPFSKMLSTQFLNITAAAGYIETNPFSGVTTLPPAVSAAMVTETTQTPVSIPTLAPVTAESYSPKSNTVIIGAAVGVGCFLLLATAAVAYIRFKYIRASFRSCVATGPAEI